MCVPLADFRSLRGKKSAVSCSWVTASGTLELSDRDEEREAGGWIPWEAEDQKEDQKEDLLVVLLMGH